MHKLILSLIGVLGSGVLAFGQNTASVLIDKRTKRISDSIAVPSGKTLTLESGSTLSIASDPTVTNSTSDPFIRFNSGANYGGVSFFTDPADPDHSIVMLGAGLKLGTSANGITGIVGDNANGPGAGLVLERWYNVGNGATPPGKRQHEFYTSGSDSSRPLFVTWGEVESTSVTIVNGLCTAPQAVRLQVGDRFWFSALTSPTGVGLAVEERFYVVAKPSATTWTYSATRGGTAITTHNAAGGTWKRGGFSSVSMNGLFTATAVREDYLEGGVPEGMIARYINAADNTTPRMALYGTGAGNGKSSEIYLGSFDSPAAAFGTDPSRAGAANFILQSGTGYAGKMAISATGKFAFGYAADPADASVTALTDYVNVNGTARITSALGIGVSPVSASYKFQISPSNAPINNATAHIFTAGTGGRTIHWRTGSTDYNADYGGFVGSDYSSGPKFILGLRNATDTDVITLHLNNVGIGTGSPGAGSILDVSSTTKAFSPPRMTKTQRDAISSKTAGMIVYQTDNTPGLRVYNGTNWMRYTETAD